MDLVDIIKKKRFLGQEFLTWLWHMSEINSGMMDVTEFGPIEVWFEEKMVLDHGDDIFRQTVICQGKDIDLAEARTALKEGKKVSQAKLRLAFDNREWRMTIKAESFEITGLKLPKPFELEDDSYHDKTGRLLDRAASIKDVTGLFDKLFFQFMKIRLSDAWKDEALPSLSKWLKNS